VDIVQNGLAAQLLKLVLPVAPGLSKLEGDPLTADLRQAGLSSIAAARLMLEIEAAYNVSIPDDELTPENFATIRAIERLIERLPEAVSENRAVG
jgi:acyl carrier protein